MFSILTSSFIALLLMALSINLTACSPEQYHLRTELKRNGVLLGPINVEMKPTVASEFLLPLTKANEVRYLIEENDNGSVYLQAELIELTSDCEIIHPLPSFLLSPNGKEAELEFQLDDKQHHYHWTVSIHKVN